MFNKLYKIPVLAKCKVCAPLHISSFGKNQDNILYNTVFSLNTKTLEGATQGHIFMIRLFFAV